MPKGHPISRQPAGSAALVVPGWFQGGGVPRAAAFYLDVLSEMGLTVDLFDLAVSRSDPDSRRLLRPATWCRASRIRRVDPEQRIWRVGAPVAELEPFRYLQRSEFRKRLVGYDLVQVVAGTPAWACSVRSLNVPVVLQVATTTKSERQSRDIVGNVSTKLYRACMTKVASVLDSRGISVPSHTLVENRTMRDWVASRVEDPSQVTLLPPAVDTSLFRPPEGVWQQTGNLISVGRLDEPRKGWDRLLLAYINFVSRNPQAPGLTLIGQGTPDLETARLLRQPTISSKVRVRANVSDRELASHLRDASVFVATPHEEGLGLAALEAMASGLPVVATDTCGSREYIIEGVTGFRLPQIDEEIGTHFERALSRILGGEGHELSRASRRLCEENFSPASVRPALVQIYERCLKNHRQAS